MKLEFTRLETSSETIKVDFGDGNGFRDYPVAEAKEYGIAIPDDISNFNEIKIKGSTGVITSPEVLKSIKLKQNYEIHIPQTDVTILKYYTSHRLTFRAKSVNLEKIFEIAKANNLEYMFSVIDNASYGYSNDKVFIISNDIIYKLVGITYGVGSDVAFAIELADKTGVSETFSVSHSITESDEAVDLLEKLKTGLPIYCTFTYDNTKVLDCNVKLVIDGYNDAVSGERFSSLKDFWPPLEDTQLVEC